MTRNRAAWAIASGLMFWASFVLSVLSYKAPNALQAAYLAAAAGLLIAGIAFWVVWGTQVQQRQSQQWRRY